MNQHALNFLWISGNGSQHRLWSTDPFSKDDPTVGVVVLRNPFFILVPFRLINTKKVSLSCGFSVGLFMCILWGFLIVACSVACLGKVEMIEALLGGEWAVPLQCAFVPLLFMPPSCVLSTLPGSVALLYQACHPAFCREEQTSRVTVVRGVYWCVVSDQPAVRKYP